MSFDRSIVDTDCAPSILELDADVFLSRQCNRGERFAVDRRVDR